MSAASYAFGDSERAARRLALLARVFEPSSAAFLAEAGRAGAALAVDLGCGPGHTTELVASVLRCARSVGLDSSDAYVEAARRRAPTSCEFVRHDALALPWPVGRADTAYARFLTVHLEDPVAALDAFASQLAPGGRLLVEDVEWIRSEAEPFRRYLGHVEAVLAHGGKRLFVGPRLAAGLEGDPRTHACAVRELAVDPRDAAGMFALNWDTLREHPAVAARCAPAERDALAAELAALQTGAGGPAPISWGLRQLAIGA